ncbi:hypothetical protein SLS60_007474 [Paraconiothyrium brasiliense]|uniref:Uncharacterized protein n=1 Tax=Paraconiothyrium brasiliense TaxID=300254 RepID=A0ABR3R5I7_9PLEO
MGNLCGKSSKEDNFQGAGRTLASAPTPATKASIPASAVNAGGPSAKPKVTGPGHTCKAEERGEADDRHGLDARANKPVTGDLAKRLNEQKKQTNNQTLQQAAYENRAQRDADAATETRNHN